MHRPSAIRVQSFIAIAAAAALAACSKTADAPPPPADAPAAVAEMPAAPKVATVKAFTIGEFPAMALRDGGIVGPPAIPAHIVDRLSRELGRLVKLPEVSEKLATDGAVAVGGTPAQFGALLQAEGRKWRRVVQEIGLGK